MITILRRATVGFVAGMALSLPALADPALGRWRTAPDDNANTGIVEIAFCGDLLCGTLIEAHDSNGQPMSSPNVGRRIVWDMEPRGSGRYRNGRVWAPDRDQTYNARMDLSGDRLSVSGCVLVFCREAVWTRAR
ncbi:MAG: DUF2147 domain-containing protein [Pararhodobacter sp.]